LEATLGDKITTVRLGELEVEMVKATSTCSRRTVHAILINIEINQPKLTHMSGCKLAATEQNVVETYLA